MAQSAEHPWRFISYRREGRPAWGATQGERLVDLSDRFPSLRAAIAADALDAMAHEAAARPAGLLLEAVHLDIPIVDPEKILCVGVNFPDRNAEYKDGQAAAPYPSLFVRFARSFVGHGAPLLRPPESEQFDYEGEIAIAIGKPGRRIAEAHAYRHVAGMTLCNEGTLRDWVRHAKFNVTQGKNFDASGSMGPWLTPFRDPEQLRDVALETRVNGARRQWDRASRMIFSFPRIIAYVSTFTTLAAGDIIVCGTPTGAGARHEPPVWLKPGDVVEVEAQGLGVLRNRVADEPIASQP